MLPFKYSVQAISLSFLDVYGLVIRILINFGMVFYSLQFLWCFRQCFFFIFPVHFFQCVVQSYLQWLQDSDYNPNCHFCDQGPML
jgi:hypothetical protein